MKSSGFAWRAHLAETLTSLGFTMCVADNDVWMRAATRPDGSEYYEYVLVYTDDILSVSMKPLEVLNCLDQHYVLKPDSIGPPSQESSVVFEFREICERSDSKCSELVGRE